MLVFDHLNSSLPTIFDDLFKPFNIEHSHNTWGASRCFKYPIKNENRQSAGLFQSYTNFITAMAQRAKIIKLNHLYLYDEPTDHI